MEELPLIEKLRLSLFELKPAIKISALEKNMGINSNQISYFINNHTVTSAGYVYDVKLSRKHLDRFLDELLDVRQRLNTAIDYLEIHRHEQQNKN